MKKLLKTTAATMALGLSIFSSAAMANNTATKASASAPQPTAEQIAAYEICDFAAVGLVELIGVTHQTGANKSVALDAIKKQVAELNQLAENDADRQLTKQLDKYWRDNTDMIFKQAVQSTDDDKMAFLQALYMESMQGCLAGAAEAQAKSK